MAKEAERSCVSILCSPCVFVHDLAVLPTYTAISKHELGIKSYDRVLAIARPDDVVVLLQRPDKAYLQWLSGVGLGTKKILVLPGKKGETLTHRLLHPAAQKKLLQLLGGAKNAKKAILFPYYPDAAIKKVSRQLGIPLFGTPSLSKKFAGKVFFERWCRKKGIPAIPDKIVRINRGKDSKTGLFQLKTIIKDQLAATGHVVVRGDFGSGGSTTHVIDRYSAAWINEFYRHAHQDDVYIVEPFYKAKASPSSLWLITRRQRRGQRGEGWREGKAVHIKTSLQLLAKSVKYAGNEYPGYPGQFNRRLVMAYSRKIVKAMAQEGYAGMVGLDFLETDKGVFVMECNPRVTGAMYPWEIVKMLEQRHGKVGAALAEKIYVPRSIMSFAGLQQAWKTLLYDGTSADGVLVPYNISLLKKGVITVVGMAKTTTGVHRLFEGAEEMMDGFKNNSEGRQ